MLTLIKTILFGTWITLTPEPVILGHPALVIELEKPISAITAGANLRVDVSSYISGPDVISQLEQATEFMEQGCLTAILYTPKGTTYLLNEFYPSAGDDSTHLVLTRAGGVPTGIDFVKVVVESCRPINGAIVIWQNYKM